MRCGTREATLASLVVVGVGFRLGLVSFGWGMWASVAGAIFTAGVAWLAVYAVTKPKGSGLL